nr:hypothetical protein HmN_000380700 [Hymenolepis microstoma]
MANVSKIEEIGLAKPISHSGGTFPIDINLVGPIQGTPYLVLVDSYSKWPLVMPNKSITTHQVFFNQKLLKAILLKSLSNSPPNLNGQAEQLVISVKRELLMSQGEMTVEEILNFWTLGTGRGLIFATKVKCGMVNISVSDDQLQVIYLHFEIPKFWRLGATTGRIVTSEASENTEEDS